MQRDDVGGIEAELQHRLAALRSLSSRHRSFLIELDGLRAAARRNGFVALADCASMLERALFASRAHNLAVRCWLDAMDDAVALAAAPEEASEALLACAAARLNA